MKLFVLPFRLAVCRLEGAAALPDWAVQGEFFSVTRVPGELSVVCEESRVPAGVRAEGDWRAFQVEGPMAFSVIGVLSRLSAPLARAGISLFAISTFDTDYLLVKEADFARAGEALRADGNLVETPALRPPRA
jgi:hypothetical protein